MNKKYGVDIKWLAVTCFEMRFNNVTVVSDPYVTECKGTNLDYTAIEKCDIITLSHAHYDHITDIPRLSKKFDPIIMCGQMTAMPLVEWVDCQASKIYPVSPNLELDFGDVKVKALFGRHKLQGDGYRETTKWLENFEECVHDKGIVKLQGIGSLEYTNYLFTTPNGVKVLIWGNDPTIEQVNICKAEKPDIAILQRTTKPEKNKQMANFIKEIGCKVVIPHHHDFTTIDNPMYIENFKNAILEVAPEVEFIAPEHGKWLHL